MLRGKDAGGLVCFDGILVASVAHDGRRVARNGKLERGLLRRANQVCEHVRVGPAVCVKEHQVAATCTGHTQVKRSRQATAVSLHQRNGEVSLRHVVNNARRSIRRAVIDHDGLMASQRLVLDALEGTTYRGSVIARGDNNRDNRLPVHGARHNLARLSSPKTVPVGCLTAPTNCWRGTQRQSRQCHSPLIPGRSRRQGPSPRCSRACPRQGRATPGQSRDSLSRRHCRSRRWWSRPPRARRPWQGRRSPRTGPSRPNRGCPATTCRCEWTRGSRTHG